MTRRLQLSELVNLVQETIEDRFYAQSFWITAEITDVKKYDSKRWCFLKFIEKQGSQIATEMQGVFWAAGYQQIVLFERLTGQLFKDGMEITCRVVVKFHARYGLKLEVLEIDTSFAMGKLELERMQILDRLLRENPSYIRLEDDEYITFNKQLRLPAVVQRIALITAPNSDGQRDFLQELTGNPYGYHFAVTQFVSQLQGDTASQQMLDRLQEIYMRSSDFDVVVIVRGGGSQTDLKPFDHYQLGRQVALFPIPVFTGIGHDRNTSITDLMARQLKTPTKVAAALVDINFRWEANLLQLAATLEDTIEEKLLDTRQQLERWEQKLAYLVPHKIVHRKQGLQAATQQLEQQLKRLLLGKKQQLADSSLMLEKSSLRMLSLKKERLQSSIRLLNQLSPQTILNKGFAMVMEDDKVVMDIQQLQSGKRIKTIMKNGTFDSTINDIKEHEEAEF